MSAYAFPVPDDHADGIPLPHVVVLSVARGPMRNNNYLLVDAAGTTAVLVDPAWEADTLDAALADSGARLGGILLTHGHPDHTHLAARFASLHGCPAWLSAADRAAYGVDFPQLRDMPETPWDVGGLRVTPLPTPGHTQGSTCFRVGDHLFCGDTLFVEGCGLCPDVMAAHQLFDSLQFLKKRIPGHVRIHPGHTYVRPPGVRFDEVFRCNLYLQFEDRESFTAYRLRGGQRGLFDFR